MMTRVKTTSEIADMRSSGRMLATVLNILRSKTIEGISTKEIADIAKRELIALGGRPAFLGYRGFPDVLCTSVNDAVVHGIPTYEQILSEGDVVGLDFGVDFNGMITDAAISVIVGSTTNKRLNLLVRITEQSLLQAVDVVRPGVHIGDIGHTIQQVLEKNNFGIVRELVGHGVGHRLHEEPDIPNYGQLGRGMCLDAGMTIAIEPMATIGDHNVYIDRDGWTIRTQDVSIAAHFEHTVLVTENGAEILTSL